MERLQLRILKIADANAPDVFHQVAYQWLVSPYELENDSSACNLTVASSRFVTNVGRDSASSMLSLLSKLSKCSSQRTVEVFGMF